MAKKTDRYEVKYRNGAVRTKLLNNDDAEKLQKSPGVKSLSKVSTKQAAKPNDKARKKDEDK